MTDTAPRESMRTQGATAADMRRATPSGMRFGYPKPTVKHGNMHHLGGDVPKDNSYHAGNRTARHFREGGRNGNPPSSSREPRKGHEPRHEVAVRIGRRPPSAMTREYSLPAERNNRNPGDHKKFYPAQSLFRQVFVAIFPPIATHTEFQMWIAGIRPATYRAHVKRLFLRFLRLIETPTPFCGFYHTRRSPQCWNSRPDQIIRITKYVKWQ